MRAHAGDLFGRERGLDARIVEEREQHLLVEELRAEAVHDAHDARAVRVDEGLHLRLAGEDLAGEHAPVHHVDALPLRDELAVFVVELPRVDEARREAVALEALADQVDLGKGGDLLPVDHGDAGDPRAAELVPGVEHGADERVARVQRRDLARAAELAHRLEAFEEVRQPVRVAAAERALGVELHERELVAAEDRVEARRHAHALELGVDVEQAPLAVGELHLGEELGARHDAVARLLHRAAEAAHRALDEAVLRPEHELRPQEAADRPPREHRAALDHAVEQREVILAALVDVGREHVVVAIDRLPDGGLDRARLGRREARHRADPPPSGPITSVGSMSLLQR